VAVPNTINPNLERHNMTLDQFIDTLRTHNVEQVDVTHETFITGNSNKEGNYEMVTFTWPSGKAVLTNQSGSWEF